MRANRKKKRRYELSVKVISALMLSVLLAGSALAVILLCDRDLMSVYADEVNTPSGQIVIYEDGSSTTVSQEQPASPMVRLSIKAPSGWYKSPQKITFTAEDIDRTGTFIIKSARAKAGQNGSWRDVTDSMALELSENCTIYLEVTDTKGNTYDRSERISCFDFVKPTLNSAVNNGVLTVNASDADSGIKAIYINGFEFTELTNGSLTVRMQQFDTGYQYFTIQAMDNAGNMSDPYRVSNPYYSPEKTSGGNKESTLPKSAEATKPASATATVTEHISTDTKGNAISKNTASEEKKKSLAKADEEEEYTTIDGQGREFYTIQTKSEKVFYLIVDRNGEDETVRFLTDVTENDLLNVTDGKEATLPQNAATTESGVTDAALPNNNPTLADEVKDKGPVLFFGTGEKEDKETISAEEAVSENEPAEEEKEKSKPKLPPYFPYILMGVIGAVIIALAYYVKVVRRRNNAEGFNEEEDEYDERYTDEKEEDDGLYNISDELPDAGEYTEDNDDDDEYEEDH